MFPYRGDMFAGKRITMVLAIGLSALLGSACLFTRSTGVDVMLVESPRGTVFLERAEDGWFRTAHPFDLSPEVLAAVFRGVRAQASPTDRATGERVFSDEDMEFLSPLMSTALSKATKNQVVGFRVVHDVDGRQETTGGILYIQGRLLHLTLTQYRARRGLPDQTDQASRLDPNPTGLGKDQIVFSPEVARRSSRNEQPDVTAAAPLASVVLDYDALIAEVPLTATSVRSHPIRADKASILQQIVEPMFPASGAVVSQDAHPVSGDAWHTVQTPVPGKESDLEALREEVRTLQRRLSELESNTPMKKEP